MLQGDLKCIEPMMSRYAARYYLTGPERDRLIEETFDLLASDPDALADGPVEKAVAQTMHRVFRDQNILLAK